MVQKHLSFVMNQPFWNFPEGLMPKNEQGGAKKIS
jgi:hypothetical protein